MTTDDEARAVAGATRGSVIKLAAELVGRGFSFAVFALLLRQLSVEAWGTFTALSVWAVVLAEAGELGLQGLASQALVTGDLSLRALLRAKAVAGLIGLALALLVFPFSTPLAVLILFYLLATWSELGGVGLRARGRATEEALVILCLRASGLLFVGGWLLTADPALLGIAWAHVVSTVPGIALAAWLLRRELGVSDLPAFPVRAVLRRSAPLAVNGGLALVSLRVELLVLERLRGAADAGLFGAALRVVEFLSMVPAAIAGGAMPALAREALSASDAVRRRSAWTVASIAGAASLGLVVVAPEAVVLLGGAEYTAAGEPLRILAIAVVPLFANVLLSHALVAARRPERLPRLTALRVGLSLALALVLSPRFGPMGAAVGFLVSECVVLVVATRACKDARFPVPILLPFGSALALATPMALAVAWAGGRVELRIAVGVVVWTATVGLAWALRRGRGATRGGPG